MNIGSLIGWITGVWIGVGISVIILKAKLIEGQGIYPIAWPICIISALLCGIIGTYLYRVMI